MRLALFMISMLCCSLTLAEPASGPSSAPTSVPTSASLPTTIASAPPTAEATSEPASKARPRQPSWPPQTLAGSSSASASVLSANKKTEKAAPILCATDEVISVLPLAFRRAGVSLQSERQLEEHPYSVAGAFGLRFGARDPLRSPQYSLGVEFKRWRDLSFWREKGAFYGVGRFDIGASRLLSDSKIGSSFLMESHVGLGYRRVIKQKIELSAANTIGLRADFDRSGLLPVIVTGTLGFWFSVGYLF